MIHLVTDSTCDMTAADATSLGVHVVPLTVIFGAEEFRDGVDLTADEFYSRLEAGGEPKTSQPAPEAFASLYRELLADPADSVVSIHISSKLSGTIQSATLAAQEFGDRVSLFDTLTVSGGVQLFVRTAASLIAEGVDRDEIMRALAVRRDSQYLYMCFDTLTYLHRGGRVGGAKAFIGGVLGVKPITEVKDGVVEPRGRARNRAKGFDTLIELANAHGKAEAMYVMYSTEPDVGAEVAKRLQASHPEVTVGVNQIGPVVGTYAGPNLVGICLVASN